MAGWLDHVVAYLLRRMDIQEHVLMASFVFFTAQFNNR